jgi:hypothetical protein
MLNTIIDETLIPRLLTLGYMERLGGLTNNVTKTDTAQDGQIKRTSFPVSCTNSGQDCFATGKHLALVPDSSKKSVGFFVATSFRIESERTHSRRETARFGAKFLVWFNLGKLGITDCYLPFTITQNIATALRGEFTDKPYPGCQTIVTITSIQNSNARSAFGQYTFGENEMMFMYPYAFAAYDIDIKVDYPLGCLPELILDAPIDCIAL